jgi:hypothetical protein
MPPVASWSVASTVRLRSSDHLLRDAAAVLPRADVRVHVEEDVEIGRQVARHPGAPVVVVRPSIGAVRHFDEQLRRRLRIGARPVDALDERDRVDGFDVGPHGGGRIDGGAARATTHGRSPLT